MDPTHWLPDVLAAWGPGVQCELDDATRARALEVLAGDDAPRVMRPTHRTGDVTDQNSH